MEKRGKKREKKFLKNFRRNGILLKKYGLYFCFIYHDRGSLLSAQLVAVP